jgi:DNA (cytosine-5)-methyltransferase 1
VDWGKYATAIAIWEALNGPAPSPVEPGSRTGLRLAPRFVEWMQGLPAGWATDLTGVSRRGIFRLLGNTVVPHQAVAALRLLEARREVIGR